ncbi:MAG: NHL domain-containing protein [Myxococcales bacterium]
MTFTGALACSCPAASNDGGAAVDSGVNCADAGDAGWILEEVSDDDGAVFGGAAPDLDGGIVFTDSAHAQVLRIDASGHQTVLAGDGSPGFVDGPGSTAQLNSPWGIAVDEGGLIYVADACNDAIRVIDHDGGVSTLVRGLLGAGCRSSYFPTMSVAVGREGQVYASAFWSNSVYSGTADGGFSVLAGNGACGHVDGLGGRDGGAEFCSVTGLAADTQGNVYVMEWASYRLRKIDASGVVTTLAGNGQWPDLDGQGTAAQLGDGLGAIAVGPSGDIYMVDTALRQITPAGGVTTIARPSPCLRFSYGAGAAGIAVGSADVYIAGAGNGLYHLRRLDGSL